MMTRDQALTRAFEVALEADLEGFSALRALKLINEFANLLLEVYNKGRSDVHVETIDEGMKRVRPGWNQDRTQLGVIGGQGARDYLDGQEQVRPPSIGNRVGSELPEEDTKLPKPGDLLFEETDGLPKGFIFKNPRS